MKGKNLLLLISFIILVVLAVVAVYIYFKDAKLEEVEIETREIIIKAEDIKTGNLVIVNFTVIGNHTAVATGVTREDSFVKVNVPINLTTAYPSHPDYYSDRLILTCSKNCVMELNRIGNLSIQYEGSLNNTSGQIKLNISVNESIGGEFAPDSIRHIGACVRWSGNIIEVTNNQYKEAWILNNPADCNSVGYMWIEEEAKCGFWCKIRLAKPNVTIAHCEVEFINLLPPVWLQGKVDACWVINKDITEREPPLNFVLNYRAYETINEEDFINLYIIDADKIPELDGFYRYEWNGKNVGANDFLYVIK